MTTKSNRLTTHTTTVVPAVCDHTFCQPKVLTYGRWSYIAGKVTKNVGCSAIRNVVTNARWSLTAVVTYSRYYCTAKYV